MIIDKLLRAALKLDKVEPKCHICGKMLVESPICAALVDAKKRREQRTGDGAA